MIDNNIEKVSTKCSVVKGSTLDIGYLEAELKKFSASWGTKIPAYLDDAYTESVLSTLIDKHLVLIAKRDQKQVGFIVGLIVPHIFNPTIKTLAELLFWVNEDERGKGIAAMLIDEYIDFGKKNSFQWITFGLNVETNIKENKLIKRGFRHLEKSYLLEVI